MKHAVHRSDRRDDRRLDRPPSSAEQSFQPSRMVLQMCMRHGKERPGCASQERSVERLRVFSARSPHEARNAEGAVLPGVVRHGQTLPQPGSSSMARLRGARDQCVRSVARSSRVLAGHGLDLPAWSQYRARRCQRQLRAGQLHLDSTLASIEKSQASERMARQAEWATAEARP